MFFVIADQTPTPTRFLKNCEEVGLFNELASPFEHDFKKATEDDIKKVANVVVFLTFPAIISHILHSPIMFFNFIEIIYSCLSSVTTGFIPTCNAHHAQQS